MRVLREGEPVSGASFEMEGIPKGETNSEGYVSFLVPYADNITLKASKGKFKLSQTVEITELTNEDDNYSGDNTDGAINEGEIISE